MAITINSTPFEKRLLVELFDARGQKQTIRIHLDDSLTLAAIASFLDSVDAATNGLMVATVEQLYGATGQKGAAVDAPEANISEMMEIILTGVDPVTTRLVSRAFRIGAMTRSDENYPAGSLKATDTNIAAIVTFLNAHYAFQAPDQSIHVGLLQVDTAASHHVTVEDIVDLQ